LGTTQGKKLKSVRGGTGFNPQKNERVGLQVPKKAAGALERKRQKVMKNGAEHWGSGYLKAGKKSSHGTKSCKDIGGMWS